MIDTTNLRELAQAVKGWSNCNRFWNDEDHDNGVYIVGHINEDDEKYPLFEIDADGYVTDDESVKLAEFYAAANPETVLALLDELDSAKRALAMAGYTKIEGADEWKPPIGPSASPLLDKLDAAERMFYAACEALGAINNALGLDPDDGGAAPILDEVARLQKIEDAARNLAKVKGRHNSEIAMNQLLEALK